MPIIGLDHINIRTTDVASSAEFYEDVFGFKYVQGPVVAGHQSNWLHDREGRAIIHFRVLEADSSSTGPIDHVALNCDGKARILERLKARDVEHAVVSDLFSGVTQVYLKDPHGVPLELYFDSG